MLKFLKRWSLLIILIIGLSSFFYFDLQKYLTFDALKQHRAFLLSWTEEHYFLATIIYILTYIIVVAFSIPGAVFLTLLGGFLFGIVFGTLYVVTSATIGALCLFYAVKTALEPWITQKAASWIHKMRAGFQQNATQYLLILRLIPLFPFWVVNIAAALSGVSVTIFLLTTFFGIIPGALIYVSLGNGLGHLLEKNLAPNLNIILEPFLLLPLLGLALLILLPSIYKFIKDK